MVAISTCHCGITISNPPPPPPSFRSYSCHIFPYECITNWPSNYIVSPLGECLSKLLIAVLTTRKFKRSASTTAMSVERALQPSTQHIPLCSKSFPFPVALECRRCALVNLVRQTQTDVRSMVNWVVFFDVDSTRT